VRQDFAALGGRVLEVLDAVLAGNPAGDTVLQPTLVVRASA
jgi:DNA-binding LacI/PurR family transcriptional regulator